MEQEIKLFRRNIIGGDSAAEVSDADRGCVTGDREKNLQPEEDQVAETSETNEPSIVSADEPQNPGIAGSSDENSSAQDPSSADDLKGESNVTDGQPKALKKPDKILPCPRCSSMDTKFCYYNNYNISQPRHFCRSCQRYWTAGGMMRNIPVGAGRRKMKNSTSSCRDGIVPEALGAARTDDPSSFLRPGAKLSSSVLSFSPESTLCETMASDFKLADKRVDDGLMDKVANSNDKGSSNQSTQHIPVFQNLNGFPSPVPCVPSFPWPFPWNPCVPLPAIYPAPFFPPPYWNCAMPNPWTVPWLPVLSPPEKNKETETGPISPLGKHSRNGELLNSNRMEAENGSEAEKSESSIVVPKTLRIDDPEEAAKSSIWETLGIKYGSISREGLFRAFQPKYCKENVPIPTSQAMKANPAALSRSISFQESS